MSKLKLLLMAVLAISLVGCAKPDVVVRTSIVTPDPLPADLTTPAKAKACIRPKAKGTGYYKVPEIEDGLVCHRNDAESLARRYNRLLSASQVRLKGLGVIKKSAGR